MHVPVPFSPAQPLLLLSAPAIWLLARELTHDFTRDRGLRAVLPLGLAPALWLLAVHVSSLLTRSLLIGLPVGTTVLAVTGGLAVLERRGLPERPSATGRPPSAWMWITAIGTAAAIAPMAWQYWFHDELLVNGHMSIAAEMQNGIYPPRHLIFPDTPLRYHYGFDLLTACLTALFRLQVDDAIDVATLLLWVLSWCLLWVLGERLLGHRRAWLTPLLTLFAGGVPVGCPPPTPSTNHSLLVNLVTECRVGQWVAGVPVVSFFFQHPWALGIPVAVTVVLIFLERSPGSERGRYVLLAVLLAMLSLSEMALFVTLLPSLVVAEAFHEGRFAPRRFAAMLGVAVAAAFASRLLGGFLVPTPGLSHLRFVLHAGFTDTWRETLAWNARTFGVLAILGPPGLIALRRGRVLPGLLVLGSVVVVNAVRYEGSGDIMKFATVALLVLGILGSVALARLFPVMPGASPLRPALAVALLVGASGAGTLYTLAYALDVSDLPYGRRTKPDALEGDDLAAALFLRRRVRAGDLVYRYTLQSAPYAQWAGLPQPWIDWTVSAFGFPAERIAARERLLKTTPSELAWYRAEGFRYLVLDEHSRFDKKLFEHSRAWIAAGGARTAARFGDLEVVELISRR